MLAGECIDSRRHRVCLFVSEHDFTWGIHMLNVLALHSDECIALGSLTGQFSTTTRWYGNVCDSSSSLWWRFSMWSLLASCSWTRYCRNPPRLPWKRYPGEAIVCHFLVQMRRRRLVRRSLPSDANSPEQQMMKRSNSPDSSSTRYVYESSERSFRSFWVEKRKKGRTAACSYLDLLRLSEWEKCPFSGISRRATFIFIVFHVFDHAFVESFPVSNERPFYWKRWNG